MSGNEKKLLIATFRFGIISEFVTGVYLDYGEREKLIRQKTGRQYKIPYSKSSSITRSTIKEWIKNYRNAGNRIEGLMPQKRKDAGKFRTLNLDLQIAIKSIIREYPDLTGTALIIELKHQKVIGINDDLNLSVLYRFLKKEKLMEPVQKDRRAFEASSPNEMWQSDVLHGPEVISGGKKKKAYLIAILDDHSRLIIHAQFYLSEGLGDFKSCLKSAIEKRGIPQKIYIDNGACFRALNIEQITSILGIGIVHTPPYTPQGRGKIERWFRYVRDNFLSINKDNTLEALNESLDNWIDEYHNKIHSTTQSTPLNRYQSDTKCYRPAPKDLINYFRYIEFRRVKKDRTVKLNGIILEVPVNLIDKKIELHFHLESPEDIEIYFEGISYGKATTLNRRVNYSVGRDQVKTGELFKEGLCILNILE